MPAIPDDECRCFVTAGTRTAKWAIARRDGRPHVVPVWFVLDDEAMVLYGSPPRGCCRRTTSLVNRNGRRS